MEAAGRAAAGAVGGTLADCEVGAAGAAGGAAARDGGADADVAPEVVAAGFTGEGGTELAGGRIAGALGLCAEPAPGEDAGGIIGRGGNSNGRAPPAAGAAAIGATGLEAPELTSFATPARGGKELTAGGVRRRAAGAAAEPGAPSGGDTGIGGGIVGDAGAGFAGGGVEAVIAGGDAEEPVCAADCAAAIGLLAGCVGAAGCRAAGAGGGADGAGRAAAPAPAPACGMAGRDSRAGALLELDGGCQFGAGEVADG